MDQKGRKKISPHRKTKGKLSGRERRRAVQLVVSIALFAVALVGRNAAPERMERWEDVLRQDIDLQELFSDFGRDTLGNESLIEHFGELCIAVFAGEELEERKEIPLFREAQPLYERCRAWEKERTLSLTV